MHNGDEFMKRKHIISLAIGVFLINLIIVAIFMIPKLGYSSPENAMWLSPKIHCQKIYDCLESNGTMLFLYKSDSGNRTDIIYEKNGRYYPFENNTKPILNERFGLKTILVRTVDGKYTIEITGNLNVEPITTVYDTLGSEFAYYETDYGVASVQNWFLAMDEIPENYCIYLDDLKVAVPAQNN